MNKVKNNFIKIILEYQNVCRLEISKESSIYQILMQFVKFDI